MAETSEFVSRLKFQLSLLTPGQQTRDALAALFAKHIDRLITITASRERPSIRRAQIDGANKSFLADVEQLADTEHLPTFENAPTKLEELPIVPELDDLPPSNPE